MQELSKIMKDDEDNYYVVPLEKEQAFNDLMYMDAEDWTEEDQKLAESWLLSGDYEDVQFMWPAKPVIDIAEDEICAVITVKGKIGSDTAEVNSKYYPNLSDDRWENKVETTAAHEIMRDISRAIR